MVCLDMFECSGFLGDNLVRVIVLVVQVVVWAVWRYTDQHTYDNVRLLLGILKCCSVMVCVKPYWHFFKGRPYVIWYKCTKHILHSPVLSKFC